MICLNKQERTIALAEKLAPYVNKRTLILLKGPLGSGKTFFTAQLCSFINVHETVSSPSFVLINQYHADCFPVYHIDLYRLESPEEALQLGLEEFIDEGLVIIEWPELIEFMFDKEFTKDKDRLIIKLDFHYDGENRAVKLTSNKKEVNKLDF